MKFYHFRQNNTYGRWSEDDRVARNVYIQARTAKEANKKAKEIGIYFNGCEDGIDCDCCGDRWCEVHEESTYHKGLKDFYVPFVAYYANGDRMSCAG